MEGIIICPMYDEEKDLARQCCMCPHLPKCRKVDKEEDKDDLNNL